MSSLLMKVIYFIINMLMENLKRTKLKESKQASSERYQIRLQGSYPYQASSRIWMVQSLSERTNHLSLPRRTH